MILRRKPNGIGELSIPNKHKRNLYNAINNGTIKANISTMIDFSDNQGSQFIITFYYGVIEFKCYTANDNCYECKWLVSRGYDDPYRRTFNKALSVTTPLYLIDPSQGNEFIKFLTMVKMLS